MSIRAPSAACLRVLRRLVAPTAKVRPRCRHLSAVSAATSPWQLFEKVLPPSPRALEGEQSKTCTKQGSSISSSLEMVQHWSAEEYHQALKVAKHRKQWAFISRIYQGRSLADQPSQGWAYELYLQAEARQGHTDLFKRLALGIAERPGHTPTRTLNAILHGLVLCGEVKLAVDTARDVLQHGRDRLDCSSFNVLLKGARLGSVDLHLLERIERLREQTGIEKDAISYNTLISAYLKVKDMTRAMEEFDESASLGLPTSSTYNTVIAHALERGDERLARHWLEKLRASSCSCTIESFLPFLVFACKQGNWAMLSATLETVLHKEKIPLSASILNVLMHAVLQEGDYAHLPRLLECFEKYDIRPDESTAVAMEAHLCSIEHANQGKLPDGLTIKLRKMLASWNVPIPIYGKLMSSPFSQERADIAKFLQKKDFKDAATVLNGVQQRGVRPPIALFFKLFHELVRQHRYKYAREVFKHMSTLPGNPSRKTATSFIATLKGTGPALEREVTRLLQVCAGFDDRPDTQLFTAAAVRLHRDGRYLAAIRALQAATAASMGLLLDVVAWLVMAQCYTKLKDIAGLVWCLEQMKSNKCVLDAQARKRVRRMIGEVNEGGKCRDREAIRQARRLAAQLPAKGKLTEEKGLEVVEALKRA